MPLASAVFLTEAILVSSTKGRWGFVFHFCSIAFCIVSCIALNGSQYHITRLFFFLMFSFPETEIRENISLWICSELVALLKAPQWLCRGCGCRWQGCGSAVGSQGRSGNWWQRGCSSSCICASVHLWLWENSLVVTHKLGWCFVDSELSRIWGCWGAEGSRQGWRRLCGCVHGGEWKR